MERSFRRRENRGMTLIELVVVVAVIGILAALVLSAVASSRDSARRMECQNHLKQIGIAIQQFMTSEGRLPAAIAGETNSKGQRVSIADYSPQTKILPYLDLSSLYNSLNFELGAGIMYERPENATAAASTVSVFLCPSETARPPYATLGPINYRVCLGPGPYGFEGDLATGVATRYPGGGGGAFKELGVTGPSDFTDGLSNTAMMSEKLLGSGDQGSFDRRRDMWCLGKPDQHDPNVVFPQWDVLIAECQVPPSANPPHVTDAGRSWVSGSPIGTMYNHLLTPNWSGISCKVDPCDGFEPNNTSVHGCLNSPTSFHPGIVNLLLGDGSVRAVKDQVNLAIWRALATRAGGETIDTSAF